MLHSTLSADSLSDEALLAVQSRLTRARERRRAENKLSAYQPYPKQREFHANGSWARERLLMASNQTGKTYSGGFEAAMHATGLYPDWWEGRRFDKPTKGWAASNTGDATRDTVQRVMVGPPRDEEQWGTGAIPKDCLGRPSRKQGVADALDGLLVRHVSGGWSSITFKTYDQGRLKWQGETLDWVWFDEEPPHDVYMEGLTRTNATDGLVWLTFTPLLGMSEVVRSFLESV